METCRTHCLHKKLLGYRERSEVLHLLAHDAQGMESFEKLDGLCPAVDGASLRCEY